MAWFEVTMRGDAREVYAVEADTEEEAQEKWHTGDLVMSENSGMEFDKIEEVES